jgi:hypothetical protein
MLRPDNDFRFHNLPLPEFNTIRIEICKAEQWSTQEFFLGRGWGVGGVRLRQEVFFRVGCSTNSDEDRGQRERGSGGVSPLVRGSNQFENEWTPYSD